MSDRHPVWELLDKIQMDNRDMAARIVELRAHFASLEIGETQGQWQPALGVKDPVAAIRKQIENGALLTTEDLEAELRAYDVHTGQADELRALLVAA